MQNIYIIYVRHIIIIIIKYDFVVGFANIMPLCVYTSVIVRIFIVVSTIIIDVWLSTNLRLS